MLIFYVYLTPFIPLSLRGVKGEGEEKKEGASPLLDTPEGGGEKGLKGRSPFNKNLFPRPF